MDVTRERIRRILELREILLSIQTGFSLVNAAVACAILESISGLEPSSVITEPRYLKLVTVSSLCPFNLCVDATGPGLKERALIEQESYRGGLTFLPLKCHTFSQTAKKPT